jgi:hypothetical protein
LYLLTRRWLAGAKAVRERCVRGRKQGQGQTYSVSSHRVEQDSQPPASPGFWLSCLLAFSKPLTGIERERERESERERERKKERERATGH